MSIVSSLSPRAVQAPESGIVEVVNYARGRDGLLPLWVGEGDLPTPEFISRAAMDALSGGETFYTYQRGIPELRQALSDYYARHFDITLPVEHFYVTGSGMQAIQIAVQALTSPCDELVYLTPAWPNIAAALEIAGTRSVGVQLTFEGGKWAVDLDRIAAAITPKTTAFFINTPSNPTGWTASKDDLVAILALARKHDLWIMADEIYARYYFAGGRAPSFLDVMEPDDKVMFVNSFSKNWSMTGWRVGWIVAPPQTGQVLENLIQYSTSGVAQFIQRGAVAALNDGDEFVQSNIDKAKRSRDILCDALIATNRVETLKPDGALYAFLKIDGVTDSRRAAIDIVDKTGVGLAPGTAFGSGGELFLRACFLRDPTQIQTAADRLCDYILKL
ncbi:MULTISPECIES: pyridoxal phosphate-dependent aminotransferase [Rhizobium]|uniref:Aminotransferase n=1 Tax=Rhizobium favelukesii TaxID=348824 RepID=W6R617_9HYPH|nr:MULTISPECIES: pyridoxal phosphate-dependent aminotransferase [Rhizobium]MCA0800570.1 pyridoxal phosphate-dependent aminotransferase [Rhizobium sp. T1473]MCS0457275.1 pyridoxal phosphate-dependent aminotransferase [Rhizobium favelukesii]UFS81930.1 pyridoxal phosphate-dependent aminotransferase [Rhizobium sp. T136]CDM56404.1 aspartate aminotransferase [Rhizobium favelukesii]